ncbi:hypothetical protein QL093DRAFT_2094834 [Fusarium oxysporum]|nr:hypothetical protein QL093DRAFT_2094834 [Fusarium oxysporum]
MSHPKITNDSDVIVAGEKQDGIHRQASFSEATAQMFQTDLEKEKTIQGTAHFHRLGWKRLTVVLIVQAIALGSLSLPGAFATLGMVAGVISCIGIGLIAMYASYMVGLVKLKYPDVDHYVDAAVRCCLLGAVDLGYWLSLLDRNHCPRQDHGQQRMYPRLWGYLCCYPYGACDPTFVH